MFGHLHVDLFERLKGAVIQIDILDRDGILTRKIEDVKGILLFTIVCIGCRVRCSRVLFFLKNNNGFSSLVLSLFLVLLLN